MNNNLLQPFLYKGRALFLAYDHGFEHGPKDLIGKSINPEYILDLAVKGKYTGIILQKGVAEKYYTGTKYQKEIPLILKINGKTNIPQITDPYSSINCSVEYAKKLGAKAVGYTIYLGSKQEEKMLEDFGKIQEQAHQLKMAAIAWIYPRGSAVEDESSPEITAYAARVGLELGAESGGPKVEDKEILKTIELVIKAGATGIAVGRNVFQHQDPLAITEKIKEIVFN